MAYEQKINQGSLFANQKQSERQPDYKGSININGQLIKIAGWNRTSNSGKQYISLKVDERSDQESAAPAAPHVPLYQQAQQMQQRQQPQPMPENVYEPQQDDLPF